jgi:hypothetical protein
MVGFVKKGFRFVRGLLMYFRYADALDFNSLVGGKRIAIVGAASSAYNTNKGDFIDGFDIVIRINKAPHLLKEGKSRVDIGAKTDVLFHSFYENEASGGGKLDVDLFERLGIKFLINPIDSYAGRRVTFNFYKKYLVRKPVFFLKDSQYRQTVKELSGFEPTIGFCALKAVLNSPFSELYITGFTFFKTPFGEGYRDQIKEVHQVRKFLKDAGRHNPDLEFECFSKLLAMNREKNIAMDETLAAILSAAEIKLDQ